MDQSDSSQEKPIVYILHGDDSLAIEQSIAHLLDRMGDAATADLNTVRLDGKTASEEDLLTAAMAAPFLAERRVIIYTHPLTRIGDKPTQEHFTQLLERLPPTTAFIMVIHESWRYRRSRSGDWEIDWEILKPKHWLMKWIHSAGKRVLLMEYPLPHPREMPEWIRKRGIEVGGQIAPAAAAALADLVGTDTRLASQEIEKLLTYVNFERQVEVEDVHLLTKAGGQANVFDMVDAIAERKSRKAVNTLERLLEDNEPSSLFFMIVRQFRLLLQTREILDEGGNAADVQSYLSQPRFVAQKLNSQANHFSMEEIEKIYRRLLELDEEMKTSQMPPILGLNLLLAEITPPTNH